MKEIIINSKGETLKVLDSLDDFSFSKKYYQISGESPLEFEILSKNPDKYSKIEIKNDKKNHIYLSDNNIDNKNYITEYFIFENKEDCAKYINSERFFYHSKINLGMNSLIDNETGHLLNKDFYISLRYLLREKFSNSFIIKSKSENVYWSNEDG